MVDSKPKTLLISLLALHFGAALIDIFAVFYSTYLARLYSGTIRRQLYLIAVTYSLFYLYALITSSVLLNYSPFELNIYRIRDIVVSIVQELIVVGALCSTIHFIYLIGKAKNIDVKLMPYAPFIHPTKTINYWRYTYLITLSVTGLILAINAYAFFEYLKTLTLIMRILFSIFLWYLSIMGIYLVWVSIYLTKLINIYISIANLVIIIMFLFVRIFDFVYDIFYYRNDADTENEFAYYLEIVTEFCAIVIVIVYFTICRKIKVEWENYYYIHYYMLPFY